MQVAIITGAGSGIGLCTAKMLHDAGMAIVGVVVCVAAFLLNAASFYVPFVGGVVFVLAIVLALRLRRRADQKHAGLRILR